MRKTCPPAAEMGPKLSRPPRVNDWYTFSKKSEGEKYLARGNSGVQEVCLGYPKPFKRAVVFIRNDLSPSYLHKTSDVFYSVDHKPLSFVFKVA